MTYIQVSWIELVAEHVHSRDLEFMIEMCKKFRLSE
jgi:hypothetical protein